tara:strand:- start:487 stop:753 length:267 start_codon:yes stop_codon:yes gene_type:complete
LGFNPSAIIIKSISYNEPFDSERYNRSRTVTTWKPRAVDRGATQVRACETGFIDNSAFGVLNEVIPFWRIGILYFQQAFHRLWNLVSR